MTHAAGRKSNLKLESFLSKMHELLSEEFNKALDYFQNVVFNKGSHGIHRHIEKIPFSCNFLIRIDFSHQNFTSLCKFTRPRKCG
jgi:hypothetical protein